MGFDNTSRWIQIKTTCCILLHWTSDAMWWWIIAFLVELETGNNSGKGVNKCGHWKGYHAFLLCQPLQ